MPSIYLSYRKRHAPFVKRLYERLLPDFGGENILIGMSVDRGSRDFSQRVHDTVMGADLMLVVIGPDWVDAQGFVGPRYLDDPNDRVRSEIGTALASKKLVVPVLVGGAEPPTRQLLPSDIQNLVNLQAFTLSDYYWERDTSRLLEELKELLRRRTNHYSAVGLIPEGYGPMSSITDLRASSVAGARPAGVPSSATRPQRVEADTRDIFISYVEEDSVTARGLATALRALGYTTWTYEDDASPGVSYLIQADEAIESCSIFVLVASSQSIQAHQVLREVESAHEHAKMIIPVRIGISHQQFMSANRVLRMAIGTRVSLGVGDRGVEESARKIVSAIDLARRQEPP